MHVLKFTAWIGLLLAVVWLVKAPGFEPLVACTGAVITLGGLAITERKRNSRRSNEQSQTISGASTGIQAGGNINISSRATPRDE